MTEQADPLARGQKIIDTMSRTQREKFDAVIVDLKVEWAIAYGDLQPIIVDALCKRAALNTDVSAITVGTMPMHDVRQIAENIGSSEPFLQASIDARDAALKKRLEQEVYEETPSHQRMRLGHEGNWATHLNQRVAEKMDARSAARFS